MYESKLVAFKSFFLVVLGAVPGAYLRYFLYKKLLPELLKRHWITFTINILSAFAFGLILALVLGSEPIQPRNSSPLILLFGIGFFGSFSTFSTFMLEVFEIFESKSWVEGCLLVFLSIVLGIVAAILGYNLGNA